MYVRNKRKLSNSSERCPKSERQQIKLLTQLNNKDGQEQDLETKDYKNAKKICPNEKRNNVGETRLHICAKKNDVNFTKELIKLGADVSARDNAGWTPLHEACYHKSYKVMKILLKSGADVDAQGYDGETALHDAISNNYLKGIKLLMSYGSNVHITNDKGISCIDAAKSNSIIYTFLKDYINDRSYKPFVKVLKIKEDEMTNLENSIFTGFVYEDISDDEFQLPNMQTFIKTMNINKKHNLIPNYTDFARSNSILLKIPLNISINYNSHQNSNIELKNNSFLSETNSSNYEEQLYKFQKFLDNLKPLSLVQPDVITKPTLQEIYRVDDFYKIGTFLESEMEWIWTPYLSCHKDYKGVDTNASIKHNKIKCKYFVKKIDFSKYNHNNNIKILDIEALQNSFTASQSIMINITNRTIVDKLLKFKDSKDINDTKLVNSIHHSKGINFSNINANNISSDIVSDVHYDSNSNVYPFSSDLLFPIKNELILDFIEGAEIANIKSTESNVCTFCNSYCVDNKPIDENNKFEDNFSNKFIHLSKESNVCETTDFTYSSTNFADGQLDKETDNISKEKCINRLNNINVLNKRLLIKDFINQETIFSAANQNITSEKLNIGENISINKDLDSINLKNISILSFSKKFEDTSDFYFTTKTQKENLCLNLLENDITSGDKIEHLDTYNNDDAIICSLDVNDAKSNLKYSDIFICEINSSSEIDHVKIMQSKFKHNNFSVAKNSNNINKTISNNNYSYFDDISIALSYDDTNISHSNLLCLKKDSMHKDLNIKINPDLPDFIQDFSIFNKDYQLYERNNKEVCCEEIFNVAKEMKFVYEEQYMLRSHLRHQIITNMENLQKSIELEILRELGHKNESYNARPNNFCSFLCQSFDCKMQHKNVDLSSSMNIGVRLKALQKKFLKIHSDIEFHHNNLTMTLQMQQQIEWRNKLPSYYDGCYANFDEALSMVNYRVPKILSSEIDINGIFDKVFLSLGVL